MASHSDNGSSNSECIVRFTSLQHSGNDTSNRGSMDSLIDLRAIQAAKRKQNLLDAIQDGDAPDKEFNYTESLLGEEYKQNPKPKPTSRLFMGRSGGVKPTMTASSLDLNNLALMDRAMQRD